MIRIANVFAPPSGMAKQINAKEYLDNGGHIHGKYVWALDGQLLGVGFNELMEENGSYCIIFAKMDDVSVRFCINSEYVKISN